MHTARCVLRLFSCTNPDECIVRSAVALLVGNAEPATRNSAAGIDLDLLRRQVGGCCERSLHQSVRPGVCACVRAHTCADVGAVSPSPVADVAGGSPPVCQDATTSNAIIAMLDDDEAFGALAEAEAAAILRRDQEDGEKLGAGIALAVLACAGIALVGLR